MSETLADFVQRVKKMLIQADRGTTNRYPDYIDLSSTEIDKIININHLLADESTPVDPLAEVFAITLQQIELGQVDKVKLAINELLKDCLVNLNDENQTILVELYLYRLKQIFKRCMQKDFPFHDEVWDYIGNCLKTVGLYLFEKDYCIAVKQVLEALAQMGRSAAQNGLPTSNTQACLRALENKAIQKGHPDIALAAKNFRFNMET
jgi:hypothetical protein